MSICDCAGNARTIRLTSPRLAEERLFEALGEVYRLPGVSGVQLAGFAAGQMAAYLADQARLAPRGDVSDEAWEQLADLRETSAELLADLAMAKALRRAG